MDPDGNPFSASKSGTSFFFNSSSPAMGSANSRNCLEEIKKRKKNRDCLNKGALATRWELLPIVNCDGVVLYTSFFYGYLTVCFDSILTFNLLLLIIIDKF